MGGGRRVGGVIFMSLLYYMFQSILNIFAFVFSFGVKKLINKLGLSSAKLSRTKFGCNEVMLKLSLKIT